jgi:hypothetical protein
MMLQAEKAYSTRPTANGRPHPFAQFLTIFLQLLGAGEETPDPEHKVGFADKVLSTDESALNRLPLPDAVEVKPVRARELRARILRVWILGVHLAAPHCWEPKGDTFAVVDCLD